MSRMFTLVLSNVQSTKAGSSTLTGQQTTYYYPIQWQSVIDLDIPANSSFNVSVKTVSNILVPTDGVLPDVLPIFCSLYDHKGIGLLVPRTVDLNNSSTAMNSYIYESCAGNGHKFEANNLVKDGVIVFHIPAPISSGIELSHYLTFELL